MIFSFWMRPEQRATVMVPQDVIDRLSKTCFRGTHVQCAGNFFRWSGADTLLEDAFVQQLLDQKMEELWTKWRLGIGSLLVVYHSQVGWESTVPLKLHRRHLLERFKPNHKSRSLRVKLLLHGVTAPKTNLITIVYDFKLEEGEPTMIIRSIYPGLDIGPLAGDVTRRTQRVFFDWDHPGAP